MDLFSKLKPYCDALNKGIEDENWHLSLMAACTLPDICSSLEGKRGGRYYAEWFDRYVKEYQVTVSRRKGVAEANTLEEYNKLREKPLTPADVEQVEYSFFTGVLAYALRCAFLHNGDGELAEQSIHTKDIYQDKILDIDRVRITKDPEIILCQRGNTVEINPKHYCAAVLEGIEKWIAEYEGDPKVLGSAARLLVFE